ncbi:MAG TPA: hypothetical protein VFQ45_17155 [Longimicrobium sp.]|nr:hypothetical protein [Longimicrobium sp.]
MTRDETATRAPAPVERVAAVLDWIVAACALSLTLYFGWYWLAANDRREAILFFVVAILSLPSAIQFAIAAIWMRDRYPRRWWVQAVAIANLLLVAAVFGFALR